MRRGMEKRGDLRRDMAFKFKESTYAGAAFSLSVALDTLFEDDFFEDFPELRS